MDHLIQVERLKDIQARIPTFTCIPGCTDCCGPVPFSKVEWDRVAIKKIGTTLTCPYANNGCEIYNHRPIICRLFGTVKDEPRLACPHGKQSDTPLTPKQAEAIMHDYDTLFMEQAIMPNTWAKQVVMELNRATKARTP